MKAIMRPYEFGYYYINVNRWSIIIPNENTLLIYRLNRLNGVVFNIIKIHNSLYI